MQNITSKVYRKCSKMCNYTKCRVKGECLINYHPLLATMEAKEHCRRFPIPAPRRQHADDLSATTRAPVWQEARRSSCDSAVKKKLRYFVRKKTERKRNDVRLIDINANPNLGEEKERGRFNLRRHK